MFYVYQDLCLCSLLKTLSFLICQLSDPVCPELAVPSQSALLCPLPGGSFLGHDQTGSFTAHSHTSMCQKICIISEARYPCFRAIDSARILHILVRHVPILPKGEEQSRPESWLQCIPGISNLFEEHCIFFLSVPGQNSLINVYGSINVLIH